MPQVFIALGANLENPKTQLDNARNALFQLAEAGSFKISPYYHSVPMGDVIQPDYINAVARFNTKLDPMVLLDELQRIEREQGRERLVRWGPRTLDLDLLLYGNEIINTPRLTVPHYGMKERSFVLVPLVDIAPELVLPCNTPLANLITPALRSEIQPLSK